MNHTSYIFILLDDMSSSRVIALIGVFPGSGRLRNNDAVLTTNWKQSLSMSVRWKGVVAGCLDTSTSKQLHQSYRCDDM